jgi:prepilin signal peptidase PulO-like enzyme (type II secretory pathway)
MAAVTLRFADPTAAVIFGAYTLALVLLLATDLDQRLLPNEVTLPAIRSRSWSRWPGSTARGAGPAAARDRGRARRPGLLFLLSIPFGAGAIGQGDLKLLVSVGLLAGPLRLVSGWSTARSWPGW